MGGGSRGGDGSRDEGGGDGCGAREGDEARGDSHAVMMTRVELWPSTSTTLIFLPVHGPGTYRNAGAPEP
ncbi:hypothetical protein Slala05_00920 [Streptomyces lavendulae subsp. lavendulae]|nr:hypothetical protein Slala05_00920 [Streptomyces lavendulae subsp. lavendulae]